jgi:hypothetical protein
MFSVVEAAEPQPELGPPGEVLAVRARVERDIEDLRQAYAPELGPTVQLDGRDYPYRAYISKEEFAAVMVRLVLDLNYSSFKSIVSDEQGISRARLYSRIWSIMNGAEQKLEAAGRDERPRRRA